MCAVLATEILGASVLISVRWVQCTVSTQTAAEDSHFSFQGLTTHHFLSPIAVALTYLSLQLTNTYYLTDQERHNHPLFWSLLFGWDADADGGWS